MKKALVKRMVSFSQKIGGFIGIASAMLANPQISSAQSMDQYSALPPLSVQTQSQQSIMLAMSLDHQLFIKAYNDFSDLTGDKNPDNTYVHSYDYVGYFDSKLCYEYQTGTEAEIYFNTVGERNDDRRCASGQWSGNFLNWATMTRIDLVRQVLYGGYRYIDEPGLTVLERSYLPNDAHSFAKYVPADIDLDGLAIVPTANSECAAGSTEERCKGFTFCNTTAPPDANLLSQDVHSPPLLRVVKGNFMLWDASERYQCLTVARHYPERRQEMNPNGGHGDIGSPVWQTFIRETFDVRQDSEAKQVFGVLPNNNLEVRFDPAGANLNDPDLSGIQAFSTPPLKDNVQDYVVRVSVCQSEFIREEQEAETEGEYDCRKYGENYKPIGILQRYGAGSAQYDVQFGLLTGSPNSNKAYGALRKNVADFRDEVNADGTFRSSAELAELNPDAPSDSIVHSLNAVRILDYLYDYTEGSPVSGGGVNTGLLDTMAQYSGTYQAPQAGDAACRWGQSNFDIGRCRNWGNPFSQILAESYRYLTGAAEPSVNVGESANRPRTGVSVAQWQPSSDEDASDAQFSCPAKGVLGFNASSVSYDGGNDFRNSTPSGLRIPNSDSNVTLATLTNSLGITGNYFVGNNGTTNDGLCSMKSVTNLGDVRGTCPETPRLEGGYLGAGLAKYIFEEHEIRTFGVSLTDALPRIRIPIEDNNPDTAVAQIVPACRNVTAGGNCALMSFKVIEDPIENFSRPLGRPALPEGVTVARAGSYYVAWEDSEQGGDYDVDAAGVIRYERLTNGQLIVETELLYNGSPDRLLFGYVISGTSGANGVVTDGVKFPAVTPGRWEDLSSLRRSDIPAWRPTNGLGQNTYESADSRCAAPNTCVSGGDGRYQRFSFNVSSAGSDANFLPSPLELAATHGSGIGDQGHAEVDDPSQLRGRLDTILKGLFNELKPGTGAGVSTNAITGEGLILSSLYSPELTHVTRVDDQDIEQKISWVGHLNGLFYKDGMFWENCHQPDPAAPKVITIEDCVVEIGLDDETKQTVFSRYKVTRDGEGVLSINLASKTGPHPYQDLQSLWSADAELSNVDQPLIQRAYGTDSSSRRHILTAVAADDAVNVTSDDLMAFVVDNFAANTPDTVGVGARNFRMLGVDDPVVAQDIVKYIRGDETLPNSRSRTLDGKKWLLGDIVHSSAAVVGRPASNYDIDRIGDATYSEFVNRYRNRRLVTYVGANDGMLHAFNGGFFNYNTDSPGYLKEPAGVDVTEHNLGAELWAYVPYNLLPHLKWLKDPEYSHVYYVDSKVHTFDVNIFSGNEARYPEADYPGGWGTIIVVGMRFGGGDYPLDLDGNGINERTTRSAYIVMDVTNPEKPPRLLAELTDADLGFTTGDIDVMSFRRPNVISGSFENPQKNDWYLVFGSGPGGEGALRNATSDQDAHLFMVHLNRLTSTVNANNWVQKISTGVANAYVGGVTAVDWNSDFQTDMLYTGVVGTGENRGGLLHASVSHADDTLSIGAPNRLLEDVDLPFGRAPLVVRDLTNNGYWVYAATGEFMVSEHLLAENIDENWIYGVRVNSGTGWLTTSGIRASTLKDISDVEVRTDVDGENVRTFSVTDPALPDVTTPEQMELVIRGGAGWRKELRRQPELVMNSPMFTGTTLAVSAFSPTVEDDCKPSGTSRLYWLNMFTGLPQTENRNLFVRTQDGVGSLDSRSGDEGPMSDHTGDTPGIILGGAKAGTDIVIGDGGGGLSSIDADQNPPLPVRRAWREVPMSELD